MRAAIIDMGTNTFHLLLVDVVNHDFKFLFEERVAVRIGVGGINNDIIHEDAITRTLITLLDFKRKINEYKAEQIFAFGTSALRNAKNRTEVIPKIKETTGINPKIISGEEEAIYIYKGVNLALQLGQEKSLIMDIGGGSVEFIIGNGKEIFWKQSFEIGAQRLLEKFQKNDPILKTEIEELNKYFESKLKPLFESLNLHTPTALAGSSGTFDTLSEIYCIRQNIKTKNSPETPLTVKAFEEIYAELITKDRTQRMQIPGMIELRVDMIVVACCLVKFILDKHNFNRIRVSSYSLKEGVLATLLRK